MFVFITVFIFYTNFYNHENKLISLFFENRCFILQTKKQQIGFSISFIQETTCGLIYIIHKYVWKIVLLTSPSSETCIYQ